VDDVAEIEPEAPLVLVSSQSTSTAIDSDCWPEVLAAPSGPVAAASAVFADRLLRRAVAGLPMRVAYPDGTVTGAGDASSPTLTVNDPDRLARRMGRHGLIGFGESYMAGEWKSTDLVAVLTILAPALNHLVPRGLRWLKSLGIAAQPGVPRFSRQQMQRNIAAHYDDVSSDLFIEFLDETMTYSSALFDSLPRPGPTWLKRNDARSTFCWIRPASDPAPDCWRSAPDGANCVSARPPAAPSSAPSPPRIARGGWPANESPLPANPIGCASICAIIATSTDTTTP
jgi:cyclopropane-fatty-acyl-phospholipid synthase